MVDFRVSVAKYTVRSMDPTGYLQKPQIGQLVISYHAIMQQLTPKNALSLAFADM